MRFLRVPDRDLSPLSCSWSVSSSWSWLECVEREGLCGTDLTPSLDLDILMLEGMETEAGCPVKLARGSAVP